MSAPEFFLILQNIVKGYTNHKIRQRRFSALLQSSFQDRAKFSPEVIGLIVRELGDEIASENYREIKTSVSTAAADRIIVEHADLFSVSGYEKNFRASLQTLPLIVNEMGELIFKEKKHLGTVAAFLAFGATFAVHCELKEGLGQPAVEAIVTSVTEYLAGHLLTWLKSNGGLDMLRSAQEEGQKHYIAAIKRKLHFADLLLRRQKGSEVENPLCSRTSCRLAAHIKKCLLGNDGRVADAWYDYAVVLSNQGCYAEALDVLGDVVSVLTKLPHRDKFFIIRSHLLVGLTHIEMSNFQEAIASFQKALDKSSERPHHLLPLNETAECYHLLGYVYQQTRDLDKALQFQNKAIEILERGQSNSNDVATSTMIASCFFRLGCIYSDKRDLKQSVTFHRKSWGIIQHLSGTHNLTSKLPPYIHLAVVLYEIATKADNATVKKKQINKIDEVFFLLDAAAREVQSSYHLLAQLPQYRLKATQDLLSLGKELCKKLSNVLPKIVGGVKKLEEASALITRFEKLHRVALDVKHTFMKQTSSSYDGTQNSCCSADCTMCMNTHWDQSEQGKVPPEILARGPSAFDAYKKALEGGRTRVKRVPVMLIGQDRSGKTSVMNSLTGKPFNSNEASTVGIEVEPSHFEVSTEIWKTKQDDGLGTSSDAATSYEHHIAQLIINNLKEEETVVKRDTDPLFVSSSEAGTSTQAYALGFGAPVEEEGQEVPKLDAEVTETGGYRAVPEENLDLPAGVVHHPNDGAHFDLPKDGSTSTHKNRCRKADTSIVVPEEIPESIATLIERLLLEVNNVEEEEEMYTVLWDFGGQSVYYATHPLFLTSRAIYILLYDLSRNPQDRAVPIVKQGLYKKVHDIYCGKTNLDYLDFWMSSVASLSGLEKNGPQSERVNSKRLPAKLPPVLLVCSHADTPYADSDARDLAVEIFGSLQAKPYSQHLFEDVFVVDNTKSGSAQQCLEVVRLRQEIHAIAKELPQMKEDIPVNWLKYENALQVIRQEGRKWISLDEARQIAREVCTIVNDEEFYTLLNVLHDQRILIHFSDTSTLSKIVVLDIQWLIDVFRKVITVKPYEPKEKLFRDLWVKLETTGILESDLLEHVWGPLIDQQETVHGLLAIMEKFSLLCPWPFSGSSKQYLVPSMLVSHPTQEVLDLLASACIPSLVIKFSSGQVPQGFFPRLVLQFFQWCSEEWSSQPQPQFFHNFARFYTFPDKGCSVILLCHSMYIEIVVHSGRPTRNSTEAPVEIVQSEIIIDGESRRDTSDVVTCRGVYRQLGLMLDCMRNEFCWLRHTKLELSVACTVCCQGGSVKYCSTHHVQRCKREQCLHFFSESDLRNCQKQIVCHRSPFAGENKVQTNHFSAWFAFLEEQAVDQHDGRPLFAVEALSLETLLNCQLTHIKHGPCSEACYLDWKRFSFRRKEWIFLTVEFQKKRTPMEVEQLVLDEDGDSEQFSVALPCGVMDSLKSESCDPKDIVAQLQDSLQLDRAALVRAEHETKGVIRCLAERAKCANRLDVVQYLRKITPAGTTGPLLPENLNVQNIPLHQRKELTINLCGGDEWKLLAEKLGLSPAEIRYLDNRTLNPCDAALAHMGNQFFISVGNLYDVLVKCEMPQYADIL